MPRLGPFGDFTSVPADKKDGRPAVRHSQAVLNARLAGVLILVCALIAISLINTVVTLTHKSAAPVAAVPTSIGDGLAQTVAADYLDGAPTSQPLAKGLTPALGRGSAANNTYTSIPVLTVASDGVDFPGRPDGRTVEVHKFRVTTSTGVFELDVSVVGVLDDTGARHPILAADPSLMPTSDAASQVGQALDYSQQAFAQYTINHDAIDRKVKAWATAFTTGTPNDLADLAGGTTNTTKFQPLGNGFTVGTDGAELGSVFLSATSRNYVIARVSVPLVSANYTGVAEYDLLIRDPAGDPKIVSWGPAGFASSLTDWTI